MTTKIAPRPNLTVAALAYDGLASFEFGIAVEVFGLPRPEFDPWHRFVVCAERRGDLRATAGLPTLGRPERSSFPAGAARKPLCRRRSSQRSAAPTRTARGC